MVNIRFNADKANQMYLIYINKEDLASNNFQQFICHKTKPAD